jgi:hypothetical protein
VVAARNAYRRRCTILSGVSMRNVTLHVVPHPEGWATRFAGAPSVSQTFRYKEDALAWAEGYAEANGAKVVLHGASPIAAATSFLGLHFARA